MSEFHCLPLKRIEVGLDKQLSYLQISLMFLKVTFKLCSDESAVAFTPGLVWSNYEYMTFLKSYFTALGTQYVFYCSWLLVGALCDLEEVFNLQFHGCSLPGSFTLFICSLLQIQGNLCADFWSLSLHTYLLSGTLPHNTVSSASPISNLFSQLCKITVLCLSFPSLHSDLICASKPILWITSFVSVLLGITFLCCLCLISEIVILYSLSCFLIVYSKKSS